MIYLDQISQLHIELTDKCQAACPMCPRNWFGGIERSNVKNIEISLDQFKKWFPVSFLKQLKVMYACGNIGDPLLATDCLEIFRYVAENSKDCSLGIYTNGSLRSAEWWKELALILGKRGYVTFAIDGLKDTHEIYRRNTNFNKIIENAKTFIENGGIARAESLVFAHNENDTDRLKNFLLDLGFSSVDFRPTQRFPGITDYPVKDKKGNIEYYIKSPTNEKWLEKKFKIDLSELENTDTLNKIINDSEINPRCFEQKEIFVSSRGHAYPCCLVYGTSNNKEFNDGYGLQILRKTLMESAEDLMNDIQKIDLNNQDIYTAFSNVNWDEGIKKNTTCDKKLVCIKNCSNNFAKVLFNVDDDADVRLSNITQ